MAFGKVFVRTESGETHEYELTKPSTTIGRLPGNDIVLNTTAVSRYHARIDVADGQVMLVDLGSANGTFINDMQLEPGSSAPLAHGDKVGIGDLLLIYTSPQARSHRDISLSFTPSVVEQEGLPFRMVLDEPQQLVAPGARMQLFLLLENLGERTLQLNITTSGLDPAWVQLERTGVMLLAGEQAEVIVTILPPRTSATRPGRYALTVSVASEDDPNRPLVAIREIDVVGYSGLGLDARPASGSGVYTVTARNDGNVPLDIELGGVVHERALSFQYDPAHLQIEPGAVRRSRLVVRPQRRRVRGPVEFAVVARSRDAAGFYAPVETTFIPERTGLAWPGVAALLLIAVALLVLVGGVALWAFGWQPFGVATPGAAVVEPAVTETRVAPTPTMVPSPPAAAESGVRIQRFGVSVDEAQYRTGEELELSWQVTGEAAGGYITVDATGTGAEGYLLRVDEVSSGSLSFPVAQLGPGNHNFRLVLVDEDGAMLAQQVAGVTVEAVPCRVLNAGVDVLTAPEPGAPPASPARTSSEVLLAGRTQDMEWLWVAYNDLEALDAFGWLPASEINCPPAVPVDEIVIVPPEGDPLLLEGADQEGTPAPARAFTLSPTP